MRDPDVIISMSQIVEDLVKGELVQLAQHRTAADERFQQYLRKSYLKTASLFAHSCKSVALFAVASARAEDISARRVGSDLSTIVDAAHDFGKNLGMAMQIIDDLLDYVASEERLGKPCGADLRLGIATAPVFYAAEEFPVIHERMDRAFSGNGDYESTFEEVMNSAALKKTRKLAGQYVREAERQLERLLGAVNSAEPIRANDERSALIECCQLMLDRDR